MPSAPRRSPQVIAGTCGANNSAPARFRWRPCEGGVTGARGASRRAQVRPVPSHAGRSRTRAARQRASRYRSRTKFTNRRTRWRTGSCGPRPTGFARMSRCLMFERIASGSVLGEERLYRIWSDMHFRETRFAVTISAESDDLLRPFVALVIEGSMVRDRQC